MRVESQGQTRQTRHERPWNHVRSGWIWGGWERGVFTHFLGLVTTRNRVFLAGAHRLPYVGCVTRRSTGTPSGSALLADLSTQSSQRLLHLHAVRFAGGALLPTPTRHRARSRERALSRWCSCGCGLGGVPRVGGRPVALLRGRSAGLAAWGRGPPALPPGGGGPPGLPPGEGARRPCLQRALRPFRRLP